MGIWQVRYTLLIDERSLTKTRYRESIVPRIQCHAMPWGSNSNQIVPPSNHIRQPNPDPFRRKVLGVSRYQLPAVDTGAGPNHRIMTLRATAMKAVASTSLIWMTFSRR